MIGAGPTGLGAATRLNQHGLKDWLIIDQVLDAVEVSACTSCNRCPAIIPLHCSQDWSDSLALALHSQSARLLPLLHSKPSSTI